MKNTMKAAQINRYGGGEVVEINENAPTPTVSQGHLLIEVHAAGVNPIDWKIREGYMQQMAPLQFPVTLGGDFSGIVMDVGDGVSGFTKGDEVYGQASVLGGGSGSFAEFLSANPTAVARKSKNVSHTEAAALPLAGVSALQALTEHIQLGKGPASATASTGKQTILIHGGAGGIGSFAIQLAKHLGATVAATASADDAQYVKDLGADQVIDYKTQKFEDLLHDYDAVFDTVGGETYARSFKVLRKGGVIVSMVEQPNAELMQQYGVTAISQFTQVTTERLSKLAELVEQGVIKVRLDKTFPLEQAGAALTYLQAGHPRGKVVVEIQKS
ncbi:MAG: NADPH:quinone reductase Zn-dependent oxidoreductase [Parcubacteria group bacterium Gr01-1014_38]|nr:MAG: NADPH:quinone reductase Zn-dependent oxidoreductase [Parcubacteria group bacterium Gr01-1014_38]